MQITEAVRKLTGKKTDREAYFRELQNAEMQARPPPPPPRCRHASPRDAGPPRAAWAPGGRGGADGGAGVLKPCDWGY